MVTWSLIEVVIYPSSAEGFSELEIDNFFITGHIVVRGCPSVMGLQTAALPLVIMMMMYGRGKTAPFGPMAMRLVIANSIIPATMK